MNTIETSLTGHDASIKGITRYVNRHLGAAPLARVEVYFPSQLVKTFDSLGAKKSIAALLREHGMGQALVSVRPFEGVIDDAEGDFLVRLIPAPHSTTPTLRGGLVTWLARLFPRWFVPAQATGVAQAEVAPTACPATPKMSNKEAVGYLNNAVEVAATQIGETARSTSLADQHSGQQVTEAVVIVRLKNLHQTLETLMLSDIASGNAASSIGRVLRKKGLVAAPGMKVSYKYKPLAETETIFASDIDMEVMLQLAMNATARVEPTLDGSVPLRSDAAEYGTGVDQVTAMPFRPVKPAAELTLRVLGTWQGESLQPFEQGFEMIYTTLPARFDRSALKQIGFDQTHPRLLSVASNSCPLIIQRGANNTLCMQAGTRQDANGNALPMYYRFDSLEELVGEHALTTASTQLVVNDPRGVADPVGGAALPALVIELRCSL
jgi:hypothetical protein